MAIYYWGEIWTNKQIKETIKVTSWNIKKYSLLKNVISGTLVLHINWLENFEWEQYDIINNELIIREDCVIVKGDTINIKYNY